MALVGRPAGYQVELPPPMVAKLNDVRDVAIIRPYGPEQSERNLQALTVLLGASTRPLPGPEAAALPDPTQARPLGEPTPEMQRMEAQRVMQSTTYVVGAALRGIDRGNTTRGNELLQDMSKVLHGQATAHELGPKLLKAAQEVSRHPILCNEAEVSNNAAWLDKSVQQLVKLEQPASTQQQRQAPQKPTAPEQKPKRKGPKL